MPEQQVRGIVTAYAWQTSAARHLHSSGRSGAIDVWEQSLRVPRDAVYACVAAPRIATRRGHP